MAAGPFQATAIPQLDKAKSVVIPTHEFAGPNGAPWIEERLDFPESWDLHVMDMAGHNKPVLTAQQIAAQYTVKFKNAGAWWSEIDVSGLVQATFFADPATGKPKLDPSSLELQNLVAGVQGAWVVPLFTKKVQLQAVIQGVIGAARDYEAPGNGTIVVRPVGSGGPAMGQVAGQLQVVVQPFDGLGLQFFIGTQGSISKVGPVTTLDGTPVLLGIQWAFDL